MIGWSAAQMKQDCEMFLQTLASYLPDDYLVEKISKTTENMDGVWEVLEQYYGTTLTSETFLQIDKMKKKDVQSYRQFYMRIEGLVSKHLTKGGVKVEDVTSPVTGDTLSITLKNLIVILWLQKINQKMIECVRLEYAQELRQNAQLIALMPRIADNVEGILSKHDIAGQVSQVSLNTNEGVGDNMHTVAKMTYQPGNGQRGRGGGRQESGGRRSNQPPRRFNQGGKELKCAHCDYLAQTLRLRINTNHEPTECFRKDIAVRLIAMDAAGDTSFESADDLGKTKPHPPSPNYNLYMNESFSLDQMYNLDDTLLLPTNITNPNT